ncbi:hypothetical protein JB92DRAFT_3111597 [Gautieria morchelliformis]|nr:hypothetical protein JB92DRAFT_3111597 [Gautieria morchelliformis]
MWKGEIYIEHCTVFRLATAGGIQGSMANTVVAIFTFMGIDYIIKWVDNFCFFCIPIRTITDKSSNPHYLYWVNLSTILDASRPLGIPWHPTTKKDQDFAFTFEYHGFKWTLPCLADNSRSIHFPDSNSLRP